MARRLLALLAALVLLVVLTPPRAARAEGTSATAVPIMVLAFDSEDAEDQADGLTAALKSRVRASHAWTLLETNQSLAMLTAALKCPGSRPTAECQLKIADHLKQDRFVWGVVTKAGPGHVQAEAHLYQRGKADTAAQEKYAGNLKDGNDDALRQVAQRLLDKLSGVALAVLVVKAGDLNGEVVIDGDKRFPLKNGSARIELSPDTHAVEVVAPGAPAGNKQTVLLQAGKEKVVELGPKAAPTTPGAPPATEESKPFPTRKVVGGVMAAAGVGLGIFAVERYSTWKGKQDEIDGKYSAGIGNTNGQRVPACDAPDPPNVNASNKQQACDFSNQANAVGITGIIAGSVGGLLVLGGAYFLFTGGDDTKEKKAAARPRVREVSPWASTSGAGVGFAGSF